MWRRCAFWFGAALITVAFAALPSVPIVESYVGGSAVHGRIEGGRYFVDPKHGRPIVEVSESTWRIVWWIERLWPLSALVPGLLGMFLTTYGMGPNWKPQPPPKEMPPRVLWACLAGAWITVAVGWLSWVLLRIPWATMLIAWIMAFFCTGAVVMYYSHVLREQSTDEPTE